LPKKLKSQDKRTQFVTLRFSENELEIIAEKFSKSGFFTFSDYARRTLLDGMVTAVDSEEMDFIHRQIAGMGKNINQIARHVNETDTVYQSDLKEVKTMLTAVLAMLMRIEKGTVILSGDNEDLERV
jgi:hypothetical protein